jgi:hypothetical protein
MCVCVCDFLSFYVLIICTKIKKIPCVKTWNLKKNFYDVETVGDL